jgi:hypothetical protein
MNIEEKSENERSRMCVAIAYAWRQAPVGFDQIDVTVAVAKRESALQGAVEARQLELTGTATSSVEPFASPLTSVYWARLDPKIPDYDLSDVEGAFGLLGSSGRGEPKSISFERLLADLLMRELEAHTFDLSRRTIILLQGPMIPKLRGRLLYRVISNQLAVFAITWQRNIFDRLEGARYLERAMLSPQEGRATLSYVYPSKQLDRATRHWVARLGSAKEPGPSFHVETLVDGMSGAWQAVAEEDIRVVLAADSAASQFSAETPPTALRELSEAANRTCDEQLKFQEYLLLQRAVGHRMPNGEDTSRFMLRSGLSVAEVDSISSKIKDYFQSEGIDLNAASKGGGNSGVPWGDEAKLYTAYFAQSGTTWQQASGRSDMRKR